MKTTSSVLNESQYLAVHSKAEKLLCIAGPGSGKTHVLTERIKRLVSEGANPQRFSVITYTNAAANELKARLDGIELGYCGTLHGFMFNLIKEFGSTLGIWNPSVVDDDNAESIKEDAVKALGYKGSKADLEQALREGPLALFDKDLHTPAETVALYFFNSLKDANLLSFDTILIYGLRLIAGMPPAQLRRWTHLFVDEFQDAADIDAAIYRTLPCKNKFIVGDPDQAIFGWRGGSVQNILELANKWDTIYLECNYRSSASICRAANRLIAYNDSRVEKSIIPTSEEEGEASTVSFDTSGQELSWVAHTISSKLRDNPEQSIAVLARTNKLVDQVSDYLTDYGIKVKRSKVINTPADWKLAKVYLGLLNDPENDMLAYWFIRMSKDAKQADNCRLQAAAEGSSINQAFLGIEQVKSPADLLKHFTNKFSHATCSIMEKAVRIVGDKATIQDIILGLNEAEKRSSESGEGVTVTTFHSAKGREWDIVFCPAFEQGTIPLASQDLEEERRLAFVAFTRPRHELLISWSRSRIIEYKGEQAMEPSQFIYDANLLGV